MVPPNRKLTPGETRILICDELAPAALEILSERGFEAGLELGGGLEDCPLEEIHRVVDLVQRCDALRADLLGVPECFERLVRIAPLAFQSTDLGHDGPALRLRGMCGEDGLDLDVV